MEEQEWVVYGGFTQYERRFKDEDEAWEYYRKICIDEWSSNPVIKHVVTTTLERFNRG